MADGLHLKMLLPPGPWTRAMEDGTVRIPGVTWECRTDLAAAPDRFNATAQERYDVGENGIRHMALAQLRGEPPMGIPVFFGREHMQRNIIVRRDSPMAHPRDLVGRRVGCRLPVRSGTGAAVLMMLEQGYGVPLDQVEWHMGDPTGLPVNRMGLTQKPGVDTDEANFELLKKGELDAVIVIGGTRYWSLFDEGDGTYEGLTPHPELRPLLHDPAVIADTYRRSGLYPITDLMVVALDVVERHPELPTQLVVAMGEANSLASRYRSAEEDALARREVELLGRDPHQFGLGDEQRHNLAALLDFEYRLGAIGGPVRPEELFISSTVG